MFSPSDVKNIFALFPPQETSDFIPQFTLSSRGHGFVTLQFAQAQFRGRVTKADFATQHDIWLNSLDALLADHDGEVLSIDGYVCKRSYESAISEAISSRVDQALKNVQTTSIKSEDLPNNPSIWFISHTLNQVLEKENLTSQFHIQESNGTISCTPKQLIESKRDATLNSLQSGALAYLDLQKFASDYPDFFSTYKDAVSHFQNLPNITVLDTFAVSKPWTTQIQQDCIRILEQEGSTLDVTEVIGSRLPASIVETVSSQSKDAIISALSQKPPGQRIIRVGHLILTETRRDGAIDELATYATQDAHSQWQTLLNDPTTTNNTTTAPDPKYSRDRIRNLIPPSGLVQRLLLATKPVDKALEETFYNTLAPLETANEEDFATYWSDRCLARYNIYSTGLTGVSDPKVHDQLAQLLAAYAKKELIPDTLAKARAQRLVQSRRTRKNVARLSGVLETVEGVAGIATALDKFNKKQGVEAPGETTLVAAKKVMVEDMLRRLQKQKASDGPVLFLTLVVVLFARQYDGVVYATGKFAPKLLKQLKGTLDKVQYEKVEAWKEAAKTNALTPEDRAEMVKMAEAGGD
ncbi:predicted protein [Pyrenophora tritici-repentis Pt-1C-BFP]|uniref:Uncharacterized protein n=1 Tax=Pyrenophora tritici-repentis (strain Pt-1C-BFP) TaxID=426418 RepID=B2WBE4_PYRTR|nr:uncharacterized protein PTRG_06957 [Pyrenophora tritici-repentis Pt-1C-BFP]EDU49876.1 predicted protein [Pyrenophora tritici-repentis Pt-1C-BFP]